MIRLCEEALISSITLLNFTYSARIGIVEFTKAV
jgi:hypothetical protein